MIGFSSELENKATLYSYFIGLDYGYNQSHRLYERILLESIRHGISSSKQEIVFGRTAAEFKSNVCRAAPIIHIYLYQKSITSIYTQANSAENKTKKMDTKASLC